MTKAVGTWDDEGLLIVYTGKVCTACQVQLTNRNRYTTKALCIEHGREYERERLRLRRLAQGRPTRAEISAAAVAAKAVRSGTESNDTQSNQPLPEQNPRNPHATAAPKAAAEPPLPPLHAAAFSALRCWLADPTSWATREKVDRAMRDVEINAHLRLDRDAELKALLRQVIPRAD